MHTSSYEKMRSFIHCYRDRFSRSPSGKIRVLEVGSQAYHGQPSYRDFLDGETFDYVGLDLLPGDNVDVVAKGFVVPELADDSFDVVISGQTFEHNPFFWVTMAEIARVLRPGGLACIIAPASQGVHRYPLDCWRFYPDSWTALTTLVGLDLLESYIETDEMALSVVTGEVRDSMMIGSKREHDEAMRQRLRELTQPFRKNDIEVEPVRLPEGPCVAHYRENATRKKTGLRDRLAFKIGPHGPRRVWSESDRQG